MPFVNSIVPALDILGAIGFKGFDIENDMGKKVVELLQGVLPKPDGIGEYDRAKEEQGITISANTLEVGEIQTRHSGGPVAKGEPYIVGEGGPELMIPDQNGTIVPNNQIATDQNGTIVPNNQIASSNNAVPVGMTPEQLAAVLVTAMSSVTLTVEQSPEGINIS